MALVVKDRVQVTSTTTGTGTFTLGSAPSGFQDFSAIGNGNTTYYTIQGNGEWEVGVGTYTSSGTTLSRDIVLESSNAGSLVDFSAGAKTVFVTYPAEKSVSQDDIGFTVQAYSPELTTYASTGVGMRNRIINGAMQIAQRPISVLASGTGNTFGLDRWALRTTSGSATITMSRSGVSPEGFTNSLICTVTTADASLGATELTALFQKIEGFNVSDLGWGTANAKPITISFRVRSSLTGTYGVGVQNDAGNRSYPSTFVINTADTWETKTITIEGDTTGTWNLGSSSTAIYLWFSLGAGSTLIGTANTWAAADYRGTTGQINWTGTSGATFYITGVQLEKGSTATSFDYRPYSTEFAFCQRYYEVGNYYQRAGVANSAIVTSYYTPVYFKVTKRATPSITGVNDQGGTFFAAQITVDSIALGRSSTVANTTNSGDYTADSEL
jgi:hypothetical protein